MSRSSTPACYDVRISHRRRDPLSYAFSQHATTWLVDLDSVPTLARPLGWMCRFGSRDHLGTPDRSLRENVDAWLADHGVDRPNQVLMLASPALLGYVFNPLSVFYCLDATGEMTHVIAEVRNTYGGRHCYLLQPDVVGRAEVDKAFYVSPFHPVGGHYTLYVPEPGEELTVIITLHRPGTRPFTATMTGTRRPAATLRSALRAPLASRAVSYQIRKHGIHLYLKGLRPFPRDPEHQRRSART